MNDISKTGRTLLHDAACECLSPEQMDQFEALFGGDEETWERLYRCIAKRIDAAPAAEPMNGTITVWCDGTWKLWSAADAGYASSDPDWLLNINIPVVADNPGSTT